MYTLCICQSKKAGEITSTRFTFKKIQLEGSERFLAGRDDLLTTEVGTSRAMNFYLGKEKSYIEMTLEIHEGDDTIVVDCALVRYDPERRLGRGEGRMFYNKVTDFLQELATLTGKRVIDRVDRSPGHEGVGLSGEDWDRMFLPRLERMGYEKTSEDSFSKSFFPKGENHP